MPWIVLKDLENRAKSFNLPHEVFCDEVGRCGCSHMPFTGLAKNRKTGRRTVLKPIMKRICASFTIPPGSESGPMDEAVLLCPEVAAQIASGKIMKRAWVNPEPVIPEPAKDLADELGTQDQDQDQGANDVDGDEDADPGSEGAGDEENAPEAPVPLDEMTVPQLQDLAGALDIEQPGRKKAKLIKKIEAKQAELAEPAGDTD